MRAVLVETGHAVGRKRDSYLPAVYWRIGARRGRNRAAVAAEHAIIRTVHHMLSRGTLYEDLEATNDDIVNPERAKERLVTRLEQVGFDVTLQPAA